MENQTEMLSATPGKTLQGILLGWKTPEFVPAQRGKTWFLVAGVLTLSIVAYAIYTDSATTAIVFILLAGLFFMTHNKPPRIVEVKITPLGVGYGEKFYLYSQINAFWIVYHPPYLRALYLRLGNKNFKYVKIELDEQDPVEVRRFLGREISEDKGQGERTADLFIRALRLQ